MKWSIVSYSPADARCPCKLTLYQYHVTCGLKISDLLSVSSHCRRFTYCRRPCRVIYRQGLERVADRSQFTLTPHIDDCEALCTEQLSTVDSMWPAVDWIVDYALQQKNELPTRSTKNSSMPDQCTYVPGTAALI